jgi:hypothetical protein
MEDNVEVNRRSDQQGESRQKGTYTSNKEDEKAAKRSRIGPRESLGSKRVSTKLGIS